jgi:Fic family protein
MEWSWQQPDWPEFTWERNRLARAEKQFLLGGGVFLGTVSHLDASDQEHLTVEALSLEAITTSEIEGEVLDRASVQSSIRRQLGLDTDNRRAKAPEQGIAEMMVDLHRSFAEPLSDKMLFAWHRMVTNGRTDLKDIGRYRRHKEPMQVVSGPITEPKVHYQAPPSADVPREMTRFIKWFNRTAPGGADPLPALTRAGIAHFYFECIHPFEDGNGRIGRAISEKVLAQSLGRPTLTALAATILAKRKSYYEALERNNAETELTDWLAWFAAVTIEAQRRAMVMVEFLIDKTRLLDKLRGQLNERQEKSLLRVLREGPEGFEGGLSAGKYISITKTTIPTATRDLTDMVAKGAMTRTGERRYTRYHANISLRPVPSITIDKDGQIIEEG